MFLFFSKLISILSYILSKYPIFSYAFEKAATRIFAKILPLSSQRGRGGEGAENVFQSACILNP